MTRTRTDKARSAAAASGWPAAGTVTAHAAAIAAFAYALMSLYWALGGDVLVSTIGGYVEQVARRGGALPVLIALAATAAKVVGGLLALALVRLWGRMVPRGWLLAGSAEASALLVVYGGLTVLLGALVLLGVIHPAGSVDRTALRWHVGVWDMWFLVWGILLALAIVGYWRWTATRARRDGTANRATVNEVLADRQATHLPDGMRHLEHEPELRILRRGARLIRRDAGRAESAGNVLATVRPTGSVTLREARAVQRALPLIMVLCADK